MVNLRITQAFTYISVFMAWVVAYWISVYIVEFIVNVFIVGLTRYAFSFFGVSVVVPTLDLPTPFDMITYAISYFIPLWNIGNTLFWGLIEEVAFILFVVVGLMGELTTGTRIATPLKLIATFAKTVSTTAETKRKSG